MKKLTVIDILEDDFGCEDRNENDPVSVILLCKTASGERRYIRMTEKETEERGIIPGREIEE